MSDKEIRAVVIKSIAKTLQITDVNTIPNDSDLRDDLHADSLDLVAITMNVEEELDIEIPNSAFDSVKTVDDSINFIINLMHERYGY